MGLRAYSIATAAGSALTNSTAETVLGSVTLPADFCQNGKVIKFSAVVQATATNSTDTLQVIARFGPTTLTGTAIATSDAIDVANADMCFVQGEITIRDADSSGTFVSAVHVTGPDASGVDATEAHHTVTSSVDFTAALLLEITGTWSVANAGNSCRLESLNVYEIV